MFDYLKTRHILEEVFDERLKQYRRFGTQRWPDGTGEPWTDAYLDRARWEYAKAKEENRLTWVDVLDEEVAEAMNETDEIKLRQELIQVIAVAVAWVQAIDSR